MMRSIVFLFLTLIIFGCSDTPKSYHINIDASYIDGLSFWEERALRKNVGHAINLISSYIDISYSDTMQVFIFEGGGNEACSNRIYLTKANVRNESLIAHETTHAIVGMKSACFEMEGFATFMEAKSDPEVEKSMKGFVDFVKGDKSVLFSIQFLMQNDSTFVKHKSMNSHIAYAQSGLFYLYLEEQYGREKMREFYHSGIVGLESVYGLTVDSLDAAWRKWLFGETLTDSDY